MGLETMRVVLALDKFKGTFSAQEACELLAEGIRSGHPKVQTVMRPMADGGDGTAAILCGNLGMDTMRVEVPDLNGKPTKAFVYWQNTRRLAVVESAQVLGVQHTSLADEPLLLKSNSIGLGKLIQKALDLRPEELWVGIGGTMTADAGWGAATAFGLRAFDDQDDELSPCLQNMNRIVSIELPASIPEYLNRIKFFGLCDVNVPARGLPFSLSSFLAQKGASPAAIPDIEQRIVNFWSHLRTVSTTAPSLESPYMGAGGGLAIGLSAVLPHFVCESGAERVAKSVALGSSVQNAHLTIVGEGCLDDLTLVGKTASVVVKQARAAGSKVIGVFGRVKGNAAELQAKLGLDAIYTLTTDSKPTRDLVRASRDRFFEIGEQIVAKYLT